MTDTTELNRLQLQIARALLRQVSLKALLHATNAEISCRRAELRSLKTRVARAVTLALAQSRRKATPRRATS